MIYILKYEIQTKKCCMIVMKNGIFIYLLENN